MKKWFVSLLVSAMMAHAHAASSAPIEATVTGVPGAETNGGFIVLASVDKTCRYYGDLWETAREPRGLVERIVALPRGGKTYEWMTVVRYSACLQPDGTYLSKPASLVTPAGKRFRMGDVVVLKLAS
jgi:hypothetical protein